MPPLPALAVAEQGSARRVLALAASFALAGGGHKQVPELDPCWASAYDAVAVCFRARAVVVSRHPVLLAHAVQQLLLRALVLPLHVPLT